MKRWICSLILLLTGIGAGAAEKGIAYPRKLSCRISVEETFEVVPRPGWTVYPQKELALRFWNMLIRGPEDRFSLQLNFFCDTKDLARSGNTAEESGRPAHLRAAGPIRLRHADYRREIREPDAAGGGVEVSDQWNLPVRPGFRAAVHIDDQFH